VAKKKAPNPASAEPTIENRRARHDYTIHETLEVGLVLDGTEVKSVRASRVSIGEGYVTATEEPPSLVLHNMSVGEYQPAGGAQPKGDRPRALLAHKREIKRLARQIQQKGFTIVPLKLYWKNGFAKLLIGVGEGRGKTDKRRAIAERDHKRDIERAMSKRMKF